MKQTSSRYNIVSIVFLVLSLLWVIFVIVRLLGSA